ncbi:unnamed protein product [Brassicogethes aeneus]|uniref:Transmembrane protein 199 n=1 Tax=Brassicogethes aeneus TaxID=1431903 RepID=A0A9P0BCD5_BRAAE|nr:unnamed protein product [Brassicogethes aeneus]
MTTNIGQISNPSILIKPSKKLKDYLSKIKSPDAPKGLKQFTFKNQTKEEPIKPTKIKHFITDEDLNFIENLNLNSKAESVALKPSTNTSTEENEKLLTLQDLYWLHDYLQKQNKENKVYLHELFGDSEIILPKNVEIPRSEELERRCQRLKAAQQNRDYTNMTKNVDNRRKELPEDTISYQLKQMNRHLIAIAQFIFSVLAGFAFGFIGVELLIGNLDFGFRLLLGIICSLVIALAELYFLAKKLNEDLNFEEQARKPKDQKID